MKHKPFISLILRIKLLVSLNVLLTNISHGESKTNLYGLTNLNNEVFAFMNNVENKSIAKLSKNSSRLLTDKNSKFGWKIWLQNNDFDESFKHALGPGFDGINPKFRPHKLGRDCHDTMTKFNCVCEKKVCSGDLIFEDNFNTMNWTKWKPEIRIPMVTRDGEFVSYQNRPENCYVGNGQLHILPSLLNQNPGFDRTDSIRLGTLDLKENCTGWRPSECFLEAKRSQILPPIVSARIQTRDSFKFCYGRVEVRAKLPKGDWLFPLILLEPTENIYGPGYDSGQLRVAFARGNEHLVDRFGNQLGGRRLEAGAIIFPEQQLRYVTLKNNLSSHHLGDEFHVYSLIWTNRSITLELDGQQYAVIDDHFKRFAQSHPQQNGPLRWQKGSYMAPFDQEFHIVLGVAVGGHSDFPDDLNNEIRKPWTNRDPKAGLHFWNANKEWLRTWKNGDTGLHVDYVRVYAI